MTDYIGNYKNRPRRVVFYGRVSTEHEVSRLSAKSVLSRLNRDKYEILPDGNWYSFVKNGQRYYISYSDVGH